MLLLLGEGEGLGVTRVSAGASGDVLAGTGAVRRCPGPHPQPLH